MTSADRKFKLKIWELAFGYFGFYLPYALVIKLVTSQRWPGINTSVSGFTILPAVTISTAVTLIAIVSLKGWWQFCGRRELLGRRIPCPSGLLVLSGLGTALIIATTTIVFSFTAVSILLGLVLMRGGVLTIAPMVDLIFGRRIRWFSWVALTIAMAAVLLALSNVGPHTLNLVSGTVIGLYLTGYLLRLPCLTKLAKTYDPTITKRYFMDEMVVALCFLIAIPAALAAVGRGDVMIELRQGFTQIFISEATVPAILIGILYAGLYYFGTLIYLDCRENTFCIPLNRGASLLAGVAGSWILFLWFNQAAPGPAQLLSASMIVVALLFLSPLHHFKRTVAAITGIIARPFDRFAQHASHVAAVEVRQRIFLFVCSGNTCRSPIAAAIANAEIAVRMNIPFSALKTVNVKALSAGLTASPGTPITPEAKAVLQSLNIPTSAHSAQSLTIKLADEAEMIFCMTRAHRQALIEMIPSARSKTFCLDDAGDIDDPINKGAEVYLDCALRIRDLVRLRLDQFIPQRQPQT